MADNLTLQPEGRDILDVGTQVQNGVAVEVGSKSRFGTQWVDKGKARETTGLWILEKSPSFKVKGRNSFRLSAQVMG